MSGGGGSRRVRPHDLQCSVEVHEPRLIGVTLMVRVTYRTARLWIVGLALALVVAACGAVESPDLGPDVVLLQVEGDEVFVDRGLDVGAEKVTGTLELEEGDRISTGAGSRAYFLNGGGHVLLLTAGTELDFGRFFKIAGAVMREIMVEQRRGTVLFSIPELPDGVFFQVRAGKVAMLVQGPAAEFAVSMGAGDIAVKVFTGEVDVLLRHLDGNVDELRAAAGDVVRSPAGETLELTSGGQVHPDEDELLSDLRARVAAVREVAGLNRATPNLLPLDLRISTPTPTSPDRPRTPVGPGEPGGPDAASTPVGVDIGVTPPSRPEALPASPVAEPQIEDQTDGEQPEGPVPDGSAPSTPAPPEIDSPGPVATPVADG